MDEQSVIMSLGSTDLQVLLNGLLNKLREKGFCPSNKKYNSLLDLLGDLDSEQYLWLRNEDNFKNILSHFCIFEDEIDVSGVILSAEEKSKPLTFDLPNPETKLEDIYFDNKFDKLILRIKNSNNSDDGSVNICDKLSDIIQLTLRELSELPGIGKKYIDLWAELKALYEKNYNTKTETNSLAIDIAEFYSDDMAVNFSALNPIERKNLEKLYQLKGSENLLEIVNFKALEFEKTGGVGKKFINTILNLKKRLKIELKKISSGEIDYRNMESELIISTRFKDISIEDVGVILLEDIDSFLDGIVEDDQEIFQCRWGFVEPESTLEEIGLKHNVTRERIRQKETQINNKLIRSMRLTQENIWLNIKDNINFQLPLKMEDLSGCFDCEKNFYKFLSYICGDKDIQNIVRPDIQTDMLNSFFAIYGEPCSISQIREYIKTESILYCSNKNNVLDSLEELGKIKIKDEKVYPKYLKKNEAAACVLSDHPQGLPWLDIAKIVNARNISRTELNETRPDYMALFDSDFVYLSGKGVYKNTKYIDFTKVNIDSIFESLLVFFDETNRDVFHLNEVYHKSVLLQEQDYYVIRYIVKMYGEDYGFFFDGKSQTDSVGMEKDFKNITQKDVILQAMKANNKPMTRPEIANILKSNSLKHASYYLDAMITDEQVVQVDRMLYTTPDIAYKGINLPLYIDGIQGILFNEKRPVDPSMFQHILNKQLNATYSKYFYSSIAKKYYKQNNWHRKQNLYSYYEIKYNNLTDAINIHCKSEFDINSNFKILSEYIAITKKSAQDSIGNWQYSLRDC